MMVILPNLELGNIIAFHESIKAVHLAVLAFEYANKFSGITLDNNLIIKSGTIETYFFPDESCGAGIPYYGHLFVEMHNYSNENIMIVLMDVAGRVLIDIEIIATENRNTLESEQIDMSNFSKGIYLLKTINGQFRSVNKIILN